MSALEVVFWVAIGLLAYTHLGYPLMLRGLVAIAGRRAGSPREIPEAELPVVSLIVAAHDEEGVIEAKIRNALELDYPRERLEVIVADDGSTDQTAARARAAGANLVLELPRAGKVAALNAAVERSRGEVLAFSDANSLWEPDALRRLVARLAEPGGGYVCGRLTLGMPRDRADARDAGANQEGLYWRYETAVRELESRLGGITAGNGAIYAVRRDAYIFLPPERGQDITLPFMTVKLGRRAEYEPNARASEPMAASVAAEFDRKRRMMSGAWATMLAGGMLSLRGYGPMYAIEIVSHRLLRYASPFLHVIALGTNLALLGEGWVYTATLIAQAGVLAGALLADAVPIRPFRIARYYVAVTAASAMGFWDYLRRGVPVTWEAAEGTR